MSMAYGIIFIVFFPLFIIFIRLLKLSFNDMYQRMKCKLYIAFTVFMIVLGFRFAAYNLIQFSNVSWISVETLRGEIPLYISEIFIAICYLKIMVSLYRKQKRKQGNSDKHNDAEA